jgi:hypothetical protein
MSMRLGSALTKRSTAFFEFEGAFHGQLTSDGSGRLTLGSRDVTLRDVTSSLTAYTMTGSLQYWVLPTIWIRGGLGGGMLDRDLLVEDPDLTITVSKTGGLALVGAAGYEFWRKANFTTDVQFHFSTFSAQGIRFNAPTIQVGFNFY